MFNCPINEIKSKAILMLHGLRVEAAIKKNNAELGVKLAVKD